MLSPLSQAGQSFAAKFPVVCGSSYHFLVLAIRGASIRKKCNSLISDCRIWISVALQGVTEIQILFLAFRNRKNIDISNESDLLFDFVLFQNWAATSLTELHGNLIAGLENNSRNLMSCGVKPRIALLFFVVFPKFGLSQALTFAQTGQLGSLNWTSIPTRRQFG